MKTKHIPLIGLLIGLLFAAAQARPVDLLQRYPTTLTTGDTGPDAARPWEFNATDIFRLSQFTLAVGKDLRVQSGPADLGLAHCHDGAVWAVVIPRDGGKLTSSAAAQPERIAHIWLRFHPKEISRLFPSETVSEPGAANLVSQMRRIAGVKFTSSWHAGMNAMIPEPKDLTVDVDVEGGPRRFFMVNQDAQTAEYVAAFEKRFVKPPPPFAPAQAEEAFDKLWDAFDRDYAMFVLRPDVDWAKLRDEYRPKALAAKSAYEFADVCAEMLRPLRDLHIWLKLAGADVPVFNRPRSANSNPSAHAAILGELHQAGRNVSWTVTPDKIGYLVIHGWSDPAIPAQCDEALEEMRDTRGLIVDVRLNGGGSEDQALEVAGRFLAKEFVYAYSRFRNGPNHTNLTQKSERAVHPRGPWRYNRPVVLLIGQKCMSSNESFIAMMSGDPDLVTMGDHTCGSSGNPRIVLLPFDMTVSVPRWIDYLPDGTPLDERGVTPQVRFKPTPGAFSGQRDDLLTAALERLRALPLPAQPIPGPVAGSAAAGGPENLRRPADSLPDHSADAAAEAHDASRPKVISVSPPADAQEVPARTDLRVRFDNPMDPLSLKLNWDAGGFFDFEVPQYDTNRNEFVIPMHLAPGVLHQVVVNSPFIKQPLGESRKQWPLDGFQSTNQHLAGLFAWRFRTAAATPPADAKPPKPTAVVPPSASEVARLTFAEIQFDQPMAPPSQAFPYLVSPAGTDRPELIPSLQYDAAKHTFRLPLVLKASQKAKFTIAGFRSAAGVPAEPIKLEYRSSADDFSKADQARIDSAAKEPRLLDLLASMREARSRLTSLSERVQTLSAHQDNGLFVSLQSESAAFKWQKPDRFFADASQPMLSCTVFRIGCDGQNWWWDTKDKLTLCPVGDMHTLHVCLCDPFELTRLTPAAAASESALAYAGLRKAGAAQFPVVENWSPGDLTEWWIDPQSFLPVEVKAYSGYGLWRTRFLYNAINEPLPAEAFAVPKLPGISPVPDDALNADYTNRFVNVRDGSDGRLSVRWGRTGPKGRSSSGLN